MTKSYATFYKATELINKLSKVAVYKTNTQKSNVYTSAMNNPKIKKINL